MKSISPDVVADMRANAHFAASHRRSSEAELDERARQWILIHSLTSTIDQRRLGALCQEGCRPAPYNVAELSDLDVDDEHLVPASEFRDGGGVLERSGRDFMMAPSVASPNASYWFLRQVAIHELAQAIRLRLDPFMHGPTGEFPRMVYLMQVYGRSLDWDRLDDLKEPDFGRWSPHEMSSGIEFTDYAWTPRDRELHFACEEVPYQGQGGLQSGRYLHAIYRPDLKQIVHFDGAVRIYNGSQLRERRSGHLRRLGKVGQRAKLFRTDEPISRECFADLTTSFFVWNYDVYEYFGINAYSR